MAGAAAGARRRGAESPSPHGRRAAMAERALKEKARRLAAGSEQLEERNCKLEDELRRTGVHLTNLVHAIDSAVTVTLAERPEARDIIFSRLAVSGEGLIRSPESLQELLITLFTEACDRTGFINRYSKILDTDSSESSTGPAAPPEPPSPLTNDEEDSAAGAQTEIDAATRRGRRGGSGGSGPRRLEAAGLSAVMRDGQILQAADTAALTAVADSVLGPRTEIPVKPWPGRDTEPPADAAEPEVSGVIDAAPSCPGVKHYCHLCQKTTVHGVQGIAGHSVAVCASWRFAEKYIVRERNLKCTECGERTRVPATALPDRVLVTDATAGKGRKLLNGSHGRKRRRSAGANPLMQPKFDGLSRTRLEHRLEKARRAAEENAARLAAAVDGGEISRLYREADSLRGEIRGLEAALIISSEGAVEVRCSLYEAGACTSPDDFDYAAWAAMPLFMGSELTIGTVAAMLCDLNDKSSRSRTWRALMHGGLCMARQTAVRLVNAASRAVLSPLTVAIRSALLKGSPSVLMDETPFKVRCRLKKDRRIKLSQLFTVNSCRTSPVHACYCFITPGREACHVVDLLKDAGEQLTCLTTDQYSGYFSALDSLEEMGIHIQHSACLTHLRRKIRQRLSDCRLIPVYRRIMSEKMSSGTPVNEIMARSEYAALTENDRIFIAALCVIDGIFSVDMDVLFRFDFDCTAPGFREALVAARKEKSTVLVNVLHDLVRRFVELNPHSFRATLNGRGGITLSASAISRDARVMVALLNAERNGDLKRFTENPDVELCQSVCERSLRTGVIARKQFLFLNGEDGCGAYGDLLTVVNTCRLNNVDPFRYLVWYLTRLSLRIYEKAAGHPNPTAYRLPSRQKITGDDGRSVSIGIYDSRNHIFNDGIDLTGLAPWDYAEWCEGGRAAV